MPSFSFCPAFSVLASTFRVCPSTVTFTLFAIGEIGPDNVFIALFLDIEG
jgi:hypothetical protein